jgi:hypothetical protein
MTKMMINFKNLILAWFETDRDFETGRKLYMNHGSNLSFKNVLNRGGFTSDNFKFLCYELAKLAGISEPQYKQMLAVPLQKAVVIETQKEIDINSFPINKLVDDFLTIEITKLNYENMKLLIAALKVVSESKKKADYVAALLKAQSESKIASVPVNVKRSIKLRDQFPFLKRKDCPGVLKELVADMLTDYENFVANHAKLIDEENPEMVAQLSKDIVEDYLDNRAIWDELNHYQVKGTLLGQHPIFEWINRRAEIRAMATPDLIKLRDALNNNIPRTRKLILDEPDHKDTAKRAERVEAFERELSEVKASLGLNV